MIFDLVFTVYIIFSNLVQRYDLFFIYKNIKIQASLLLIIFIISK